MRAEIRIIANDATLEPLHRLARQMSPDSRELLNKQAGIKMHELVMETFRLEGATQGRPRWQDLAAGGRWQRRLGRDGVRRRYRFQDIRRGKGGVPELDASGNFIRAYKILQDTGDMRNSYVWLSDADHAGVGTAKGASHADIAIYHEYGVPARNLPARPMLPTNETALVTVYQVYALAIAKAVRP